MVLVPFLKNLKAQYDLHRTKFFRQEALKNNKKFFEEQDGGMLANRIIFITKMVNTVSFLNFATYYMTRPTN